MLQGGALSAAVFWGIGSGFQQVRGPAGSGVRGSGFTSGQMTAKIAAHGAAGGTLSVLQGGKFGHGFVSAGITEAVSPAIAGAGGSGPKGLATRAVLSAAVGGTVSKITGGKFANGAATGAFASLFNDSIHQAAKTAQKVFAFDGAGADDGSDNPAFHKLADAMGAELYDSGALGGGKAVYAALTSADKFLADNPNGQIYAMGYSAGGADAIAFTNALAVRGITVAGLVTFDPHSSGGIGLTTFHLAGNVGRSVNFYQQNKWNLLFNTFRGSPVTNWAMASNPNISFTGLNNVNHSGIVSYAIDHYKSEIYSALGH